MRLRTLVLVSVALFIASVAAAQFRRNDSLEAHLARPSDYDGKFHYCRAVYRPNFRGDGGGWTTDYPLADIDLSIRLAELTKVAVAFDAPGRPRHLIVQLMSDELFQCPVIIMQEVGRLLFTPDEAARLRSYLLKGGFLWVDDFWGSFAWEVWESQIRKVLPSGEYPFKDLPLEHMIYHQVFTVSKIPQIPSINQWLGARSTSERGSDSRVPHIRGITDERGRLMVLMTHNTDFGDSW